MEGLHVAIKGSRIVAAWELWDRGVIGQGVELGIGLVKARRKMFYIR